MTIQIWVSIGPGNGLLPDGTKPLPEPMLTYHQWSLVAFTWGQFHMKCSRYLPLTWVWKSLFKITSASPRDQWVKQLPNSGTISQETTPIFRTCSQIGQGVWYIHMFRSSLMRTINWPYSQTQDLQANWHKKSTRTRTQVCVLRIPLPPHDYPYYWFILDPNFPSQNKTKSKLQI